MLFGLFVLRPCGILFLYLFYTKIKYELQKIQTGLCIWIHIHRSSLKRCTSSRAWLICIMRWSLINVMQRFCCDRGKKTMYLLLCKLWLVLRPPAYVCCKLNMPWLRCRATLIQLL